MDDLRDLPPRSSSRRLSPFFLRSRVSSSASSSRLRFSSFFRALAFPSLDDDDEDEDEDEADKMLIELIDEYKDISKN